MAACLIPLREEQMTLGWYLTSFAFHKNMIPQSVSPAKQTVKPDAGHLRILREQDINALIEEMGQEGGGGSVVAHFSNPFRIPIVQSPNLNCSCSDSWRPV